MATVTGMTADRMLAIEAASVVDGDVVGDNLILTKHDGTQINAGSVRGNPGPPGPVGSDLLVLDKIPILDVGTINQIRAGRQLTAADFTNMGLSAPLGLWNLSDLSDVSGNGRNLLNKGAVPFGAGINGAANTAAQFSGSAPAQALYIPDTGAADPFRIKTGSVGCWFKTAKRGSYQMLVDKYASAPNQIFSLMITDTNAVRFGGCPDGSNNLYTTTGVSDVTDNYWHFAVAIHDGTNTRLYIDGILESIASFPFTLFSGSAPLNIGARGADGSTASAFAHFGRIDEAFITADILSEDQIRNLYCAKIPHTLAAVPSRSSINIRRRKRGATLVAADFSTQPLRLYNFSGGSIGDEGSNGAALTNPGNAVSVAGVDGSSGNAINLNGAQSLIATDAGLPSALASRSYGCWFKSSMAAAATILNIGGTALGTADIRLGVSNGTIFFTNGADVVVGPFVCDGQWHYAVAIEDNTEVTSIKRKLYVDGKLVLESTVMNPLTLRGAGGVRVGCAADGAQIYTGQVDGIFICGYALTSDDVLKLYNKASMALTPSPKNVGDHVEAMSATDILVVFDSLENIAQVDLRVAA